MKQILFSTAIVALAVSAAMAQSNSGVVVPAAKVTGAMVVDGHLDEPTWGVAPPISDFKQRDPLEGEPATERTEVRVAFDDKALYLGLRLFDREPKKIVRRLSRRDEPADADLVRIYLDPRHDHRTGFMFEVSAAGVQSDSVLYNDDWDDSTWDGVWASAVSIDETGWTAEFRLPFSELRFSAEEHPVWGLNVSRLIQRKNETAWLVLVPKTDSGVVSRLAHIEGLEGVRPRTHVALLPYAVARGEWIAPDSPDDPFHDGSAFDGYGGLDLKYGLPSGLVVDGTVNPDFGQVEVDPAVVNLTDFETFFEEKRPFFTEGAQTLASFGRNGPNQRISLDHSEPQLYYSRRIGRFPQGSADAEFVDSPAATTILGAGKLTGKTATGWSIGVLEAVTAREWARYSDGGATGKQEVEPLTNSFVARTFRDAGRAGYGVIAAALNRNLRDPDLRSLLPGSAYTGGFDGYFFLDGKKDWVLAGGLAGSRLDGSAAAIESVQRSTSHYFQRPDAETKRLDPEATSLSGWTGQMVLNRQSGRFRLNTGLWGISPGFDSNDLGYNRRSDLWGGHLAGQWRKTTPGRLFRSATVLLAKSYSYNFDRDNQADSINGLVNLELLNFWWIYGSLNHHFRAFDDRLTRGGPTALAISGSGGSLGIETDSRKRASMTLDGGYSGNERGGWSATGSLSLQLKPFSWFSLSVGPELLRAHVVAQWVTAVDDATATSTFGRRYVFGEMNQTEAAMTLRLNWIVSPRMSLQIYAQPLLSVGDYEGFKEFARPREFEFVRYGVDAGTIDYDAEQRTYTVVPNGNTGSSFRLRNPDFNFKSLRVNAVFRWEYKPGSTLYVAFTSQKENFEDPGSFDLGRDFQHLWGAKQDNVLLVKIAYRLGR